MWASAWLAASNRVFLLTVWPFGWWAAYSAGVECACGTKKRAFLCVKACSSRCAGRSSRASEPCLCHGLSSSADGCSARAPAGGAWGGSAGTSTATSASAEASNAPGAVDETSAAPDETPHGAHAELWPPVPAGARTTADASAEEEVGASAVEDEPPGPPPPAAPPPPLQQIRPDTAAGSCAVNPGSPAPSPAPSTSQRPCSSSECARSRSIVVDG
mmetsp:Transcript_15183/g.49529  ORF Transcript_15183/g.49529 Transcript_15183/m.49529 type:complete len:216 (-) Transcript_15183:527-1174(-)